MRETAKARRQAPRHVASILDAARKLGIRDAQAVPGPGRPQLRAGAGGTRALTPWCGARAGRVRAPAGCLRLCVLFQIGDELIPGLEQFLLVDDVVAVEDGAGLVAGQEHGDPLGQGCNAGSYTYPDMRWTAAT